MPTSYRGASGQSQSISCAPWHATNVGKCLESALVLWTYILSCFYKYCHAFRPKKKRNEKKRPIIFTILLHILHLAPHVGSHIWNCSENIELSEKCTCTHKLCKLWKYIIQSFWEDQPVFIISHNGLPTKPTWLVIFTYFYIYERQKEWMLKPIETISQRIWHPFQA